MLMLFGVERISLYSLEIRSNNAENMLLERIQIGNIKLLQLLLGCSWIKLSHKKDWS